MRIAAAQVLAGADPSANLDLVAEYTAKAAAEGARVVAFPEATMRAFGAGSLREVAEEIDGPWATRVGEIAREHEVVVMAGMFQPAGDEARVFNAYLVTGIADRESRREIHTVYRKIHLYDAFGFRESDTVAGGTKTVIVEVDDVPIGITVCYDIRFPGQFRALAREGAQINVCAASWANGPTKLDHWRLLTRARALDSTTPLVAVGQPEPGASGGEVREGAPQGVGHSMIVGADATVLAEAGDTPELLVVDIDPEATAGIREQIPVLRGGKVTE